MPMRPPDLVFRIKDDGKALGSPAQTIGEINSMSSQAQQEWQEAVNVSRSPVQRAAAEEAYAWGLMLIGRSQQNPMGRPNVTGIKPTPNLTLRSAKLFASATRDDPASPIYWQSLGDAIWATRGDSLFDVPLSDEGSTVLGAFLPYALPTNVSPAAVMIDAYRRSLSLQPDNAALWTRLADNAWNESDASSRRPDSAIALLRSAIRHDPDSANLHYRIAAILFSATPYGNIENAPITLSPDARIPRVAKEITGDDLQIARKALREIESGNSCANFADPTYSSAVPSQLRASWGYWSDIANLVSIQFPANARLRNLAREAAGYAFVEAYDHRPVEATRAANDVAGIGAKMAGDWPTKDVKFGSGELIRTLVGSATIAIGDRCLTKVAAMSGDGEAINAAEDKWKRYSAREAAYKKASTALLATYSIASLFDSY